MADASPTAERIIQKLTVHLGPHVARIAMKTFAKQALSRSPDTITAADVPKLLESMRSMLVVMMGREAAAVVVEEIRREFS
jgi:hypothetical protein